MSLVCRSFYVSFFYNVKASFIDRMPALFYNILKR